MHVTVEEPALLSEIESKLKVDEREKGAGGRAITDAVGGTPLKKGDRIQVADSVNDEYIDVSRLSTPANLVFFSTMLVGMFLT